VSNSQKISLQHLPERRKKPLSVKNAVKSVGRGNDGKVISTLTAGTRKSESSPSRIFHPAVFSLIGSASAGSVLDSDNPDNPSKEDGVADRAP
jgi:hypothetical protein